MPAAERKPKTAQQKAAAQRLWKAGVLSWKLDPAQELLDVEVMAKRGTERMVLLCSRGWGKTYYGLVKLIEECLQHSNHHVAFVTKTKSQAKGNIRQSAEDIFVDCPADVRPQFLKNDARYEFTNGSTLTLLGVDSERFDLIRGRAFHAVVVDETQNIDQLETVIKAVLDPCVMRVDGWMLLTGTVPESGEHEFIVFVEEAVAKGTLIRKTILECPRYDKATIDRYRERAGGEDSDIWQREWMVALKFSSTRRVIPEWTTERAQTLMVQLERPEFCDRYVGLDFAFSRDLTVALFGYYDFARNALVIEDELTLKPSTTAVMAASLEAKEAELWGPMESRPDVARWADGQEARTVHELRVVHRLPFRATDKKDKQMSINNLRILVQEGRLFISPKCKLLNRTLLGASWAKNHKLFDRAEAIGHADALDALLYLSRNVKWGRNPFPTTAGWIEAAKRGPNNPAESATVKSFRDAFTASSKPGNDLRSQIRAQLKKFK